MFISAGFRWSDLNFIKKIIGQLLIDRYYGKSLKNFKFLQHLELVEVSIAELTPQGCSKTTDLTCTKFTSTDNDKQGLWELFCL